jgi:hypothetical protein
VLIFLVPFLLLYSVPRLEKAPTDTDEQVISIGFGAYFSPKALALTQGPLENIEVLKGDPNASTDTVAVVYHTGHLVNTSDNSSVTFSQETYAFNRNTGVAENCCGEQPKMSGETLKFPFGTQKTTYKLWDTTGKTSLPVSYVRTEKLDGIDAYVFQGRPIPVNIGTLDLPNSLIGVTGSGSTTTQEMFQTKTTVWVEPVTGQVLKGEQHLEQWAELNGARVLGIADLNLAYSPKQVRTFVDQAQKNVKQLTLVKTTIPVVGGIAGLLLVILSVFLLRPRPATDKREAPAAAAAA